MAIILCLGREDQTIYDFLSELNKTMTILPVSHDIGIISPYIKSIACVNRDLHYHDSNEISEELLKVYNCPIEMITHGTVPHRVMKSHNQTHVSLGIKNLKGTIDVPSRKKCHNADPVKDLNFHVARLADKMPPMLTLFDGIFTNERGPGFDGRMHRSNLLIASKDVLSADLVGSAVLGHPPETVPHLVHAAKNHHRPLDLSDVAVVGERIEDVAVYHEFDFNYVEDEKGDLPAPMAKEGIQGVFYRKYDLSMCTYCSGVNGLVLSAIRYAWKGKRFDDVEVLTGKMMKPTPGKKKTIPISIT